MAKKDTYKFDIYWCLKDTSYSINDDFFCILFSKEGKDERGSGIMAASCVRGIFDTKS